jgi:hypothetical protein
MGGDDLDSDDDYLAAPLGGAADNAVDSSSEEEDDEQHRVRQQEQISKRQRTTESDERIKSSAASNGDAKEKRKPKKRGGPMQVLGSKIRLESAESKAEILSEFAGAEFQASHMAKLSSKNNYDVDAHIDSANFKDRLLCLVSKKQLKNKLKQRSPKVVIFCLSARRSVAILKDLAPMRLRVAKLFPKQGTIGEQARQLETTEFALAVGTPHRIKELVERGSLTLKNTQLLGLDTFLNPKNQSVYTLHDTAPFLRSILKDHAQPLCVKGKKDLKIAFV